MALTFLWQHFKRNAPKSPPENQPPPPSPPNIQSTTLHSPASPLDFSSNQEPLTDDASIGSEALSDGERFAENTPPPDGEQDSGICADSGSNFSQQESGTSPTDEDDPEPYGAADSTPDFEQRAFLTEPEIHRHIEGPTPDCPVNEDTLTRSSENFERFRETRDSEYLDTEEYNTGTLTDSADVHDILSAANESPSSSWVSGISGEEQDADANPRPSLGDDLGELDRKSASSSSSEDLEDEGNTSLSEIQSPPVPPPPPLPGLRFMGDHTTSSTTDSTVSASERITSTANGTDLSSGCENRNRNLADEIRSAAAGGEHWRKTSTSRLEMFSVPTSKRLSETVNDDIKAVIAARQAKLLEQSAVDDFETRLPQAKATFYQARIGVAPEDTELGRLFRKRAEKLLEQPSVEPRTDFDAVQPVGRGDDEQPRTSTDVSSSTPTIQDYKSENGEHLEDSIDESAEDDVDSDDDTIRQSSVNEFEDGDALSEFPENPSRYQETQPLQDKSGPETQNEENEDDFDAAVKDLDQVLFENCSSSNLALSTDHPSVASPSSSSSGYFEMASGCSSPSDFPELSPTSFVFEDVFDDDVVTNTAEVVVREHSKLLSRPLESYNILPSAIAATETGNSPNNSRPKRSFTFRNLLQSFRKPFRAPTAAVHGRPDAVASTADGKLEFDDNWSIHDTIRDKEKAATGPRSLQVIFGAAAREVRSLSEFVESSTRESSDTGKDFSVRNWKDVLEKSSFNGGGGPAGSPDDQATDAQLVFIGSRSSDGKPRKSSKSRTTTTTTTEVPDDISSDLSNTGSQRLRLGSSGLSSTIPSCRNHVMMQSLDSIFPPVSHQDGQRHYQQNKYSLTAIASNALLSPVVRRQQRNHKK